MLLAVESKPHALALMPTCTAALFASEVVSECYDAGHFGLAERTLLSSCRLVPSSVLLHGLSWAFVGRFNAALENSLRTLSWIPSKHDDFLPISGSSVLLTRCVRMPRALDPILTNP